MPRPHYRLRLNNAQEAELRSFIQTCLLERPYKLWARRRAQALLALHEGKTIAQIARQSLASERSVRNWIKNFQQCGLAGLTGKLRGRQLTRKSRASPPTPPPLAPAGPTKFRFVPPQGEPISADQPIMTPAQVASYLNLSRYTVHRLVRQGKLPGAKIGGQWRFRKEDIYNYFSRRLTKLVDQRTKEVTKYFRSGPPRHGTPEKNR